MSPEDPPWRVLVPLAEVRNHPGPLELAPDAAARERIGRVLGLDELKALSATVAVAPWLDGVSIAGRWVATVVQTCGVSLEPFATGLEGAFELKAVPADSAAAQPPEAPVEIDPDAEDPPDVLEGEAVDVAAYVVEHLALEIDPFPRRPGVAFEPPAPETPPSPFAVLAQLRTDPGSKP